MRRRPGRPSAQWAKTHGNGTKLPVQQAERNHRRLTLGVARVAEGVNAHPVRIGQVEEPPPARLGAQLVEEAPQGEQSAGPVTRSVATVPSRSIARESTGSADEVGAATMFIVLLS